MQQHPETRAKSLFFEVGTEKLIELSLASFGLYSFYWTYCNWLQIARRGGQVSPIWRTLVSVVYQFDLYRRISKTGEEFGEPTRWKPARLYFLYLLFTLMPIWMLITDHYWGLLANLMTLLPNLLVNQTINKLHDQRMHFFAKNTELSGLNWALIVSAMIAWLTLMTYALVQ